MSKENQHRNIQILKSSLFPKNKTKAINQLAVPLFQYRCTIVNWPKLDINTRYKYKSTSFEMQKILSHPNSISSTWVIHWHICKHFNIPVPEQLWKQPKSDPWRWTFRAHAWQDDTINCGNCKQSIASRHSAQTQNEKVSIVDRGFGSRDVGINAAEIRKITKYWDLKNEVKRTWKLKKGEIIPVIVGATEW